RGHAVGERTTGSELGTLPGAQRRQQVSQRDGAGGVADQVEFEGVAPGVGEYLDRVDKAVASAPSLERKAGVLLHLAPDRTRHGTSYHLLDRGVGLLADPFADACRRRLSDVAVGNNVSNRLEQPGLPNQEQRVAA